MAHVHHASIGPDGPIEIVVDVWHPECWTLNLTADGDAGLVGYGTTAVPDGPGRVGYYTAYADTRAALSSFLERMRGSEHVDGVTEHRFGPAIAPVTTNVVVRTGPTGGMRDGFRERGFLHLGPTWHRNGRERRILLTDLDRGRVEEALGHLERDFEADIRLERVGRLDAEVGSTPDRPGTALSVRQREAFTLARQRGYYEYPRDVSAGDLADELEVARSTFLEHLHKAERKVLTQVRV